MLRAIATRNQVKVHLGFDHEALDEKAALALPNVYQLPVLRGDEFKNGMCCRAGEPLRAVVLLDVPREQTLTGVLTVKLVGEEESIIRGSKSIRQVYRMTSPKVIRDWSKKSQKLQKALYRLPFTIDLPTDLPCAMSAVRAVAKIPETGGYHAGAALDRNQCWVRYTLEANYYDDEKRGPGSKPLSLNTAKYVGIISRPPPPSKLPSHEVAPKWIPVLTKKASSSVIMMNEDGKKEQQQQPPPNPTLIPPAPAAEFLFGAALDSEVYSIGDKIRLSFACRTSHDPRIQVHEFGVKVMEYCGWRDDPSKQIAHDNRKDRLLFTTTLVPHDHRKQSMFSFKGGGTTGGGGSPIQYAQQAKEVERASLLPASSSLTESVKKSWEGHMQKQLYAGGVVHSSKPSGGFVVGGKNNGGGGAISSSSSSSSGGDDVVVGGDGPGQYNHSMELAVGTLGVSRLYHDGPLIQVWHCVDITMKCSFQTKDKNTKLPLQMELASMRIKVAHPGSPPKKV